MGLVKYYFLVVSSKGSVLIFILTSLSLTVGLVVN